MLFPGRPRMPVRAAAAATTAAQQQQTAAPTPSTSGRPELPKNFDPVASEERLYTWWEAGGYFRPADEAAAGGREPFVMSMPPPNVTGRLHMGHAMFATLQVGGCEVCDDRVCVVARGGS